jgi:hypothetical protein
VSLREIPNPHLLAIVKLLTTLRSSTTRLSSVSYTHAEGEDAGIVEEIIRDCITTAQDLLEAVNLEALTKPTNHGFSGLRALSVAMGLAISKCLSTPSRVVIPSLVNLATFDFGMMVGDAQYPFKEPKRILKDPAPTCTSCSGLLGTHVVGHKASSCPLFPQNSGKDFGLLIPRTGWQALTADGDVFPWDQLKFMHLVIELIADLERNLDTDSDTEEGHTARGEEE